ncbi:MAG: tRNA pseudouridine(55) synthase TruB [Actinomycetota bacterium]|nr:tRNA pseudouridine(55) synthase TruB [Actinomycetota bacterium]
MSRGFLLVDKGRGWTSHDVVGKLRGLLGQGRVGHGGTLDPMATGLLVVGVGQATRLLRYVQDLAKEYRARMVLGVATDTLDADGAVLWREPMEVAEDDLRRVMTRFVGQITQVPPMVSAVRVQGRRLYDLAREGKEVDRRARRVEVLALELVDFAPGEYPEAVLRVECTKGTYVRTLADDLARALGGRAHLSELRRTRIGSFSTEREARSMDELEDLAQAGDLPAALLSPSEGLRDLPALAVDQGTARGVGHGVAFAPSSLGLPPSGDGAYRMLDQQGRLLAVYRHAGKRLAAEVVLS